MGRMNFMNKSERIFIVEEDIKAKKHSELPFSSGKPRSACY